MPVGLGNTPPGHNPYARVSFTDPADHRQDLLHGLVPEHADRDQIGLAGDVLLPVRIESQVDQASLPHTVANTGGNQFQSEWREHAVESRTLAVIGVEETD